ncbi:MAG: class I SAM-dependent methyltransferase [Acetobacteraceae bacterium]|nr:class I SAM-dependent methyltransferase [Acetobacteraceae bacterium]
MTEAVRVEGAHGFACGVCDGVEFTPFFRSREWSGSGRYLERPERSTAPVDIVLEACSACGLVRQAAGFEVKLDYFDIARGTAKQLPDYTNRIIGSLREFGVGPDDLVIEVGANDGTFLRAVRESGHRNLVGVEPSRALASAAGSDGLNIFQGYFNGDAAVRLRDEHGQAAAVICRHTLEHVPNIRELTAAIASMLRPGGLSFIEVPDCDWVIPGLLAHEIWDEHLTYFRAGSLARLIGATGLTPVRLDRLRFRDTRNLLCWSVRGAVPAGMTAIIAEDATLPVELALYQQRWDAFAARLRARVALAPRPVVGIGASHIQLNFFNFTGLDDSIDLLVDDDPVKAGRYAPLARPVQIQSTETLLATLRGGTIIRSAFPYPSWEDRICDALAPFGVDVIAPDALK